MRIAIVGASFGERVHAPAFQRQGATVAAICAARIERARAAAERLGARPYADWRAMLENEKLDAVAIAVPPAEQYAIALGALRRGLPVFCEKPLAVTAKDAAALAREAKRRKLANMVDFEFPEIPAWRDAKILIDAGRIGKLRHAQLQWHLERPPQPKGTWKTDLTQGGGTLLPFASHSFYYLEWLFGRASRLSARLYPRGASDELATFALEFKKGGVAVAAVSSNAFLGTGHRLEAYGEDGTIAIQNQGTDYVKGAKLWFGDRKTGKLGAMPVTDLPGPRAEDGRIAPVSELAARFLDWAGGGKPSAPTFADGARVQRLLEAALLSSRRGGKEISVA